MTTENNKSGIIVAFHTGRGGRYHNAGHVTYIGEKNIGEFLNDLFFNEETQEYYGGNGELVGLTQAEVESGVGSINIDHQYDTTTTCHIEDCSEREIEMICQSNEYKSVELTQYLESVTDYKFDGWGAIIELDEAE